ncbi:MAG: hypothetical protein WDN31_04015 [Hyphomicrobium sp.]
MDTLADMEALLEDIDLEKNFRLDDDQPRRHGSFSRCTSRSPRSGATISTSFRAPSRRTS